MVYISTHKSIRNDVYVNTRKYKKLCICQHMKIKKLKNKKNFCLNFHEGKLYNW